MTKYNEAQFITKLMQQYRVRCRVQRCIATPSYLHFALTMHPQEREAALIKVLPDLERMLHDHRARNGKLPLDADGVPENTVIRYTPQPMALEVNRTDPRPLVWESRQWPARPLTSLVGRYFESDGGYPIVLDLDKPEHAHTLIAGSTGSGKSILLDGLIAGFCESTPAEQMQFLLVDLDGDHFDGLAHWPHVRGVHRTPYEASAAIAYAVAQMDNDASRRTLLCIDELMLLADAVPESMEALKDIAQRGRKHGVHLIVATQKPLSKSIGPVVKGNINVRLCGAVPSVNDGNTALDMAGLRADKLPGRGAFIFRCGNNVRRVQAYMLPPTTHDMSCDDSRYELRRLTMTHDVSHDTTYDSPRSHEIVDYRESNSQKQQESGFPLGFFRELTSEEISEVSRKALTCAEWYWRGELSWSRIARDVFGSHGTKREHYLKEVLNV